MRASSPWVQTATAYCVTSRRGHCRSCSGAGACHAKCSSSCSSGAGVQEQQQQQQRVSPGRQIWGRVSPTPSAAGALASSAAATPRQLLPALQRGAQQVPREQRTAHRASTAAWGAAGTSLALQGRALQGVGSGSAVDAAASTTGAAAAPPCPAWLQTAGMSPRWLLQQTQARAQRGQSVCEHACLHLARQAAVHKGRA